MGSVNQKRIAKNTIFLYIRMLLSMCVSFYTSRIILVSLGIDDYGVYSVVGGLTSMFVFFSTALTNAAQRFLNFELGVGDEKRIRKIFSQYIIIYSFISIIIVAVAIPVGFWFIDNKLTIPYSQLFDAKVVLMSVLISLVATFIGSVYESVLIARENMKIYAYLGIIDVCMKLIVAYMLYLFPHNIRLIVYSILLSAIVILHKIIMIAYCRKHYPEAKFKYGFEKKSLFDMLNFAGWNIYGCGVWMLNEQGINIILNIFFGPVINAARALALQVSGAVNQFATSFYTAVRPQIIKSYASEQYEEFYRLVVSSGRYAFFLMWILCLPIMLRVDTILDIWLIEIPSYTKSFLIWVLICSLINTLDNPLWTATQAVGKLKSTCLYGSTFYLLVFPISYIVLRAGASPVSVFYVMAIIRFLYLIIVAYILGGYTDIGLKTFLLEIVAPCSLVVLVSTTIMLIVNSLFPYNLLGLILVVFISVVVSLIAIAFLGISAVERHYIINKIRYRKA